MLNFSKNEPKSLFDLILTHLRQSAHCQAFLPPTDGNGMKIHAEMVTLAALGLGANVILLAWLLFLSHNVKDQNGVTLCASIWAAFLSGLLRSPTSSHSFRRLD